MNIQRINVKFFATPAAGFDVLEATPVFHQWIRDHTVGDLLIDVADYAHVPSGPGVMLIAHEAHYSLDSAVGPLGLLYVRKRGLTGDLTDRLRTCATAALAACAKLAADLPGRIEFATDRLIVQFDDRLAVPNDEAGFASVRDSMQAAFDGLYGKPAMVRRETNDARSPLTLNVVAAR